jgi:DNA-binding CsgD family transcriptional regulator
MARRADPIAVVEAAYCLGVDEPGWTAGLAEAATHLLPNTVAGFVAYHVLLDADAVHLEHPAGTRDAAAALASIQNMQQALERYHAGSAGLGERIKARTYGNVTRGTMRQAADRILFSEHQLFGPRWMYTLGVPGVHDVLLLKCPQLDGKHFTLLAAGLPKRRAPTAKERAAFLMIAAHVRAGYRLRRQLRAIQEQGLRAGQDGAVLDAKTMRVLHAEGEAQAPDARETLREMAVRVDRARTQQYGRDERALEVWQGLVDGRWSLVDQFDNDGKRLVIAHRNAEDVRDPRRLSVTEASVMGLAARGYPNKLVAYHLGISEARVSSLLHRAMAKLHIESRVDLVRMFGGSL